MKKLRYLLAVLAFVGALAFLWQDPLASKTPAKAFIDKHFSDCIIGEKFKINEKYSKSFF